MGGSALEGAAYRGRCDKGGDIARGDDGVSPRASPHANRGLWLHERRISLERTSPRRGRSSRALPSLRAAHHLRFPGAPGQLLLKSALENLLQTCGDGTTKESAEHGDVCRHMHGLCVDLYLDPEPDPLQPDLAAVGGPLHAPDQCAKPARNLVDGGLQAS